MNTEKNLSRVLGVAFLLQFITSLSSGALLKPALTVPDNISASLVQIANNPTPVRAFILLDLCTALGVVFLGAILFLTLRRQNEKIALVAFGFYLLEAIVLAASRVETFALIPISQEYVSIGYPVYLESMAKLALASMDFAGLTLHMLAFCPGAILFYYLLYKSGLVPRALSLWGLITVVPTLIAALLVLFGYSVSRAVYMPYIPFEFVIGLWILIRGINEVPKTQLQVVLAN